MAQRFSTKTPVRLQDSIFGQFVKAYRQMIEDHGASYAVNYALGAHLESIGYAPGALETPADRISRGQRKRWKSVKSEMRDELKKNEDRRERKRLAEKARRAKIKALKQLTEHKPPEE